jgi:hypothetical protein
MRGIVICTRDFRTEWYDNLMLSLRPRYPVVVHRNGEDSTYELGAIAMGAGVFEEFFFLQETTEVKNPELFELCFASPGGVAMMPGFQCYIGKYKTSVLREIGIPEVRTKVEAVDQEEIFTRRYMAADKDFKFFCPLMSPSGEERKFGRENLRYENAYLIKWKGTWRRDQL